MAVRFEGIHARAGTAERPRKRVLAAFGLGAALSVAVVAAFAASAHGPFTASNPTFFNTPVAQEAHRAYQPTYSVVPFEALAPARRHHSDDEDTGARRNRRITVISGSSRRGFDGDGSTHAGYAGSQPMCVRLCDGYFFPLPVATGDLAGQTASCNSLCPDSPTEVFYRNSSDSIEGAVSATGKPYTSLPVSLRYRNESNATCTCHRDPVAYAPLKDWTLRAGDAVMTPAGFMVFRGAEKSAHSASEFSAVANAGLGSTQRGVLEAMERASLPSAHPSLRKWLAQGAPRAPEKLASARPASDVVVHGDNKIRLLVWRGDQP